MCAFIFRWLNNYSSSSFNHSNLMLIICIKKVKLNHATNPSKPNQCKSSSNRPTRWMRFYKSCPCWQTAPIWYHELRLIMFTRSVSRDGKQISGCWWNLFSLFVFSWAAIYTQLCSCSHFFRIQLNVRTCQRWSVRQVWLHRGANAIFCPHTCYKYIYSYFFL